MFSIHGNDLYTSAGESIVMSITPQSDGGEPYIMETNDRLRLRVYSHGRPHRDVFTAETFPGSTIITIPPEKTTQLRGLYDYEVKLVYADGSETVIIGQTANFTPHFIVLEG